VSDTPEPRLLPLVHRRSLVVRWGQFLLAMACYGVAIALMVRSGLGLGPWDAFHAGLARLTGITIGQASVVVGLGVLAGSMVLGVRPGIGTLANMVLLGLAVDAALRVVPGAGGIPLALAYYAVGIAGVGFATGMYIAAALGAGPRDGLMVGLSARFGWPVRRVRTLIEASALVAGWAMGGGLGVGTALFVIGAGPATQWGMRRFGLVNARGDATGAAGRDPSAAARESRERAA
jgi:uncharacterized protein